MLESPTARLHAHGKSGSSLMVWQQRCFQVELSCVARSCGHFAGNVDCVGVIDPRFLRYRICRCIYLRSFLGCTVGFSNRSACRTVARVRLCISRCIGLLVSPVVGVLRHSSKAFIGPFDFCSSRFAIFTAASALPFDCEWYGDDMECLNSHVDANCSNSALMNCGPPSDCTNSGQPYLENCSLHALTVVSDFWTTSFVNSKKSE